MENKEYRELTFQLGETQAMLLDFVCRVDNDTQNDVLRLAIDDYIKNRTTDPLFQSNLRNRIALDNETIVNQESPELSKNSVLAYQEMTKSEIRQEKVAQARFLKDNGRSVAEIAEQIGVSQASVRLYLKETM